MCQLCSPQTTEPGQIELIAGARRLHTDVISVVQLLAGIVDQLANLDAIAVRVGEAQVCDTAAATLAQLRTSVQDLLVSAGRVV